MKKIKGSSAAEAEDCGIWLDMTELKEKRKQCCNPTGNKSRSPSKGSDSNFATPASDKTGRKGNSSPYLTEEQQHSNSASEDLLGIEWEADSAGLHVEEENCNSRSQGDTEQGINTFTSEVHHIDEASDKGMRNARSRANPTILKNSLAKCIWVLQKQRDVLQLMYTLQKRQIPVGKAYPNP
ncbi:UNVERIFIED_CONTAM: hypothetical protein FKN15_037679 [Acipenser sinensis]